MDINTSHFIEEHTDGSEGIYIIPNEFYQSAYAGHLKSATGTLLSVGTIRSVIAFALGSFDEAIFLDSNKITCAFNRAHLDLIENISLIKDLSIPHQRSQYIATLYIQWLPKEYLDENQDVDKLFDILEKTSQNLETIPPKIQDCLRKINKTMGALLSCSDLPFIAKALRTMNKPQNFEGYYWENDAGWARLTKAIRERKIWVVQGSINGSKTMASIATELSLKDKKISIVDISGTPDHLYDEEIDQFLTNLTLLPKVENVRLFFTAIDKQPLPNLAPSKKANLDPWGYYYLYQSDFKMLKEIPRMITYFNPSMKK